MTERARPGVLERPGRSFVAYDVAGAGPPIVLLHGLTSSRQAWDPVTELLIDAYTCVRVDFRGHGESSTASDYGMVSMVGDVRAVVDELQLDAPAVVGHSYGAAAAAVYAALNPARAVVCVDNSLRFGDFARRLRAHEPDLRGEHTMDALVKIEHELGLGPYADVAGLERRVRAFPREIILAILQVQLTTPPDELTAISETLLSQIGVPLLCLHGSRTPDDYASWLRALVPDAQVEVWDGMGHFLHLVDPDRFAARVSGLLA